MKTASMKKTTPASVTSKNLVACQPSASDHKAPARSNNEKKASEAAAALINAEILTSHRSPSLFRSDFDDDVANIPEKSLPRQFSIPLSMNLVRRFITMPKLPGPLKTYGGVGDKSPEPYELSCIANLTICKATHDPLAYLLSFPLANLKLRAEMPFFVLWALESVAPAVYKTLIGERFGSATEPVHRERRVLPEPIAYDNQSPLFKFKSGLVFGQKEMHPSALVHTFASGATGVGKTYGVVKPLLESFLGYKNARGKGMGLLVIDPKSELFQLCLAELQTMGQGGRLIRLGSGPKLKCFADDCELSVEDRYRTLASMVEIKTVGESSMWQEKGNRLNIDMAELDRKFQLQTGFLLWGVVRSLLEGVDHLQTSQWDNICAIYSYATAHKTHLEWLAAVSTVLIRLCPGLNHVQPIFNGYLNDGDMSNQLYYRVSNAEPVGKALSTPGVLSVINTNLFTAEDSDDLSMAELLDQERVILFQPQPTSSGDIAGRLVKSRFFADALTRPDMLQPIGYVADEFQRFITSDRETGEQSFLDRCRAYRVNCVLATQSLASIEHALVQTGERSPKLVVDILVANTPTKVIYRSLDDCTAQALKRWIPPAPSGQKHVVDIRPPAQLALGTAYYLCNGKWGIYRYERNRTEHCG